VLTKLTIRGFKRFGSAEVELANPVVFIGPNNSGKNLRPTGRRAVGCRGATLDRETGGRCDAEPKTWGDDQPSRSGRRSVIAFVGTPHRIDDRGSQVVKALKQIGFERRAVVTPQSLLSTPGTGTAEE